jgi:Na+-driven multidrug efflux pump|tara:strand:+ start:736 stop:939 length:204 start_codon:yes stop_codon:yes gene_type:complete
MWRLWAKALGQKEGRDVKEADKIAIIRTLIMAQLVITNLFIVSGNVKNLFYDTKYIHCPVKQLTTTP